MPIVDAAFPLLDQLPNGGAVVAIIVVVVLYLRKQEKSEETIKGIVSSFTTETSSARKDYKDHVNEIMHLGLDAHRETREAITHLNETITGIRKDNEVLRVRPQTQK